jgi:flagellar assembly protein FliH
MLSNGKENAPPRQAIAEPFEYAAVPCGISHEESEANPARGNQAPPASNFAQIEQQAYRKGFADGEARARVHGEAGLAEVRSQVSEALREFTSQREIYFEKVETDVVKLALSIARKILHREAQIDPLLLTGIVRVALDSMNGNIKVRLRANPEEISFWRDYFAHADDVSPVPEIIGCESLPFGHCVLETDLGSTHISLDSQLKEIERGFLDLLEQRPRVQQ